VESIGSQGYVSSCHGTKIILPGSHNSAEGFFHQGPFRTALRHMDVFLENCVDQSDRSLISRLATSFPLHARNPEEFTSEILSLQQRGARYITLRRQQAYRIGEHLLRDVLTDAGIAVSCVGYAGGFTGALGRSFESTVSDVRNAIEKAGELHSRSLVVVPGERGLHTYRHAERSIRDGLVECSEYAAEKKILLLLPTDTVLAGPRDHFRPRSCPLKWQNDLPAAQIRPMIVVRGRAGAWRFPKGWRSALLSGGCIRVCNRCDSYSHNARLMHGILNFLGKSGPEDSSVYRED
jgi:hypothetical protein